MLEVALAAVGGASVGGALVALVFSRRVSRPRAAPGADPDADPDQEGPTFGEVCLAAARAKADHDEGDHPAVDREFIDGADAVLGKLLEMDYGDDPLEIRLAYLAGGDAVAFDVDEVTREDLTELADLIGDEIPDDPRRSL